MSSQPGHNPDTQFANLIKEASKNANEIRRAKDELRNLSKKFANFSEDINPDKVTFSDKSTTTLPHKMVQEGDRKISRPVPMPDNPAELIHKVATLERDTERIISEIERTHPDFAWEIQF